MMKPGSQLFLRLLLAWLALAGSARVFGQEAGPANPAGEPTKDEGEKADGEKPTPFDGFYHAINGARLQRFFDKLVGFDYGNVATRPEAPEIGEPIFFDLSRPLGDRKYGNEINYLFNSNTRNAPGLQVIEYEYTFADWRAVEIDLSYYDGNLEVLTPFYQRTLGIGRRRNWIHGYQISTDLYLRSGFVGGSAVYTLGWKPEEKSKFSTLTFFGANRALIGGFHPTPSGRPVFGRIGPTYGSWRPTINLDLFYELTEKLTIGFEADQFIQGGRAGEYVDFPFLSYKPGPHAFFQAGGGYYRFESRDNFTFFLHLNFVNRSDRQDPKPEAASRESPEPEEANEPGPIRRTLGRLLGDR